MQNIKSFLPYFVVFILSAFVVSMFVSPDSSELPDMVSGDFSNYGVSENTPIVAYTIRSCPACQEFAAYMESQGISYENKDVEKSARYDEELQALGSEKVPTVLIGDRMIIGFHRNAIMEALAEANLADT